MQNEIYPPLSSDFSGFFYAVPICDWLIALPEYKFKPYYQLNINTLEHFSHKSSYVSKHEQLQIRANLSIHKYVHLNNLLLVIFCNQGYLRYKNKSPNSTLELGEIIRLNNVKRVQGDPYRLRVSYFYEVGEISYDKQTDIISNYTKLFDV